MATTPTPSPARFNAQWASWVLITAILLLLVALIFMW
jgi:hypothetical protein